MKWVLFPSHGSAKIFFENEIDPVAVALRLNNTRIEG